MRMNITTTISFRHEDQNSSSAKPSVPKILIITIIMNVMSLRKRTDSKELTNSHPEYNNPNSKWHMIWPIIHCSCCYSDLQR